MELSAWSFGFASIAVLLAIQVSDARDIASAGLLAEMPKKCSDTNFCLEKHVNYPQEKIDKLLTEKYQLTVVAAHEERIDRYGIAGEDIRSDCDNRVTYGKIYEILDEDDNVRVVVQSPKLFIQEVRIEQCIAPGRLMREGGTSNFNSQELKDNEIFCIEKEMDYSFLVLSKTGSYLEFVTSKIPVCCSCSLNTTTTRNELLEY